MILNWYNTYCQITVHWFSSSNPRNRAFKSLKINHGHLIQKSIIFLVKYVKLILTQRNQLFEPLFIKLECFVDDAVFTFRWFVNHTVSNWFVYKVNPFKLLFPNKTSIVLTFCNISTWNIMQTNWKWLL